MNTDDMQYFIAVYEARSIKGAARESFISHQALSKRIQGIEAELGADLFVRTANGLVPTRAGELFSKFAISTVGDLKIVEKNIADLVSNRTEIRVSAAHICPYLLDMGALLDFERRQDDYSLVLRCGNSKQCYQSLLSGESDVAIANYSRDLDGFEARCLKSEDAYIMVSAESPLAVGELSDVRLLRGCTLLSPNDHAENGWPLDDIFAAEGGFVPETITFNDDTATMMALIQRGKGYAITYESAARRHMRNNEGIAIKRIPTDGPVFNLCVIFRKDRTGEAGIRDFVAYCMQNLDEILLEA